MKLELLIEFLRTVRASTIKRLELVPTGYENWKASSNALGFAETTKHLIDIDNWLMEKIKYPELKSIETQTAIMQNCSREEFNALITGLKEILEKKIDFVINIQNRLHETIYDDAYDSEVSILWLILRRNIDHEIHHRGQLAAYLRVLKDRKSEKTNYEL